MRRYTALVMQGRRSLDERRAMLTQHRARVMEAIAQWRLALRLIDHKIAFYGTWLATGHRPRDTLPPALKGTRKKGRPRARRPEAQAPTMP